MAKKTYLQLTNAALKALNEVVLTDIATARGIQAYAVDSVNDAIRDMIGSELQWPFNVQAGSQLLTPGISQYTLPTSTRSVDWLSFFLIPTDRVTNGAFPSGITSWNDISAGSGSIAHDATNLRMTLTGDGTDIGGADQEVSVIASKTHTLYFQLFAGTVTVNVGTATGLSDITTTTFTNTSGIGTYHAVQFTPGSTTTSVFIGFSNTSATAIQIDNVKCARAEDPRPLCYMSLDEYNRKYKVRDYKNEPGLLNIPTTIVQSLNGKFIVSPLPKEDWTVEFTYWDIPADLSANGDQSVIPEQWEHILLERVKYYMYTLRSDPVFADRADKRSLEGIKDMRTELINRKDYATTRKNYTTNNGISNVLSINQ